MIIIAIVADFLRASANRNRLKNEPCFPKNVLYFVCILSIFLILAIPASNRYGIGTDYFNYYTRFNQILSGTYKGEIIFYYLNIFASLFSNFQLVIMACSLIFLACTMSYIKYSQVSWTVALFLLFYGTYYNYSFNAVRQCVATAIFLFAIRFIIQGKFFRYIFCIFIAMGFHSMAIVYIPIYFLRKMKINYDKTAVASVCTLAFIIVGLFLKNTLTRIIPSIVGYEATANSAFSMQYLTVAIVQLVTCTVIYALSVGNVEIRQSIEWKIQWVLNFVIIASSVLPIGYRLIFLLSPVQIVLIPKLFSGSKNQFIKITCSLVLVLIYAYFYYFTIINSNWHETLPYESITTVFGNH
jgi:hypothetical protein